MKEHKITFGELTPAGLVNTRQIKQSDIMKCPFAILVADHYREDGSCKCSNVAERIRMAKGGYNAECFQDIPLKD